MNATNRMLNRVVLLTTGLVLAVAGVVALALGIRPAWAEPMIEAVTTTVADLAARLDTWRIAAPNGEPLPGTLLVALAVAVIVAICALVFLLTRGGGRTADVLRIDGATGRTTVDRNVADAVLREPLTARPDVLSVRTSAHRVRRVPAVTLAVTVRKGAPLAAVVTTAESAVASWDRLAGARLPVLVHLEDTRWRDAGRARTRVR